MPNFINRNLSQHKNMLWLVCIFTFCMSLPMSAFSGDFQTNSATKYPDTPQGVVEAFVRSDFDGSANEVIGDIKQRLQYVSWEVYPGADCSSVVSKYEITKRTEEAASATVEVKYQVIGSLCGYDSYIEGKKVENINFSLIKVGSYWKIDYPDPAPFISPLTALNIVKHELSKPYLKEKKDRQIKALRARIEKTRKQLIKLQEK